MYCMSWTVVEYDVFKFEQSVVKDELDDEIDELLDGETIPNNFNVDFKLDPDVVKSVGITMIGLGWYKKSKSDKTAVQYIKEHD